MSEPEIPQPTETDEAPPSSGEAEAERKAIRDLFTRWRWTRDEKVALASAEQKINLRLPLDDPEKAAVARLIVMLEFFRPAQPGEVLQ